MQLIKRQFASVLLLLTSTTCGPDTPAQEQESTWMLGTWHTDAGPVGATTNNCGVKQIRFQEDGVILMGGFRCSSMSVVFDEEYTWERDGDHAVIVHFPEGEYWDGWRVTFGDPHPDTKKPDCNTLRAVNILDGVLYEDYPWWYSRGAKCTKTVPCPEGVGQCEPYEVIWCDEPPIQCEDALPCVCP